MNDNDSSRIAAQARIRGASIRRRRRVVQVSTGAAGLALAVAGVAFTAPGLRQSDRLSASPSGLERNDLPGAATSGPARTAQPTVTEGSSTAVTASSLVADVSTPVAAPSSSRTPAVPPTPSMAAVTATPAATAPATPATSPSVTSEPAVPVCTAARIAVTQDMGSAAAGNDAARLVYRNTSGTRCTLSDFPELFIIRADRSRYDARKLQKGDSTYTFASAPAPTTVTLGPGERAVAWFSFRSETGGHGCNYDAQTFTRVPRDDRDLSVDNIAACSALAVESFQPDGYAP